MPITALPIAPNRQDPATFSSRADAWVGALDTFTTEANALQTDVNAKQVTASNAATTATNAVQAINSALNRYTFSTTTTMADPGVGVIRFNNTTASSATAIAIDAQSADTGNPNILNLLLSFGDSTNNPKGLIRFTQAGTPANYRAYNVTAVTNNTGWVQFTVTHVASAGSFSNGVSLVLEFHRAGDAGDVQLSANNTFTGNNTFSNALTLGTAGTTTAQAVRADRTITAGNGLTGGGDLTANRTFTLGTPSTLTGSTTNAVTATSHTHALSGVLTDTGNQTTTGTMSATKLIPTGNVTAGNGMYLPTTDTVAVSTAGVERLRINADGRVGINHVGSNDASVSVGGTTIASSGFSTGLTYRGFFDPIATTVSAAPFLSSPSVSAGGTIPNLRHFIAQQGTYTGSVSDQKGFEASSGLIGATNNYGFYGNIPSGTGRWNFYANGTAANYFAGETTIASGFTIGRTGVTSPVASDGNVFSGTYTPTLTNVSNLTGTTAFQCQYMRVGDVVTVSGAASITPTSSGVVTRLGLSLPVTPSPAFNATRLLGGTFAATNPSQRAGVIYADTTNNRAEFQVMADVSTGTTIFFNFTYRVTT